MTDSELKSRLRFLGLAYLAEHAETVLKQETQSRPSYHRFLTALIHLPVAVTGITAEDSGLRRSKHLKYPTGVYYILIIGSGKQQPTGGIR